MIPNYLCTKLVLINNTTQQSIRESRYHLYSFAENASGGGDSNWTAHIANHLGGRILAPCILLCESVLFTAELVVSIATPFFSIFQSNSSKIDVIKSLGLTILTSIFNPILYVTGICYLTYNFTRSMVSNPNQSFNTMKELLKVEKPLPQPEPPQPEPPQSETSENELNSTNPFLENNPNDNSLSNPYLDNNAY